MKALVLNAIGHGFELENIDIADPIGREVLIEVKASGLCHTDLLFATHSYMPVPAVLGHEVAGVVTAIGPEVTQFRIGEHAVGSLAQTCGTCARCLSDRPYQCTQPELTLRKSSAPPRLSRKGVALYQGYGADLNKYDSTTHFVGQSTIFTLSDEQGTGEAYTLAHHITVKGESRRLMLASLRYNDTFMKQDGAWLFSERLLYVDWVDERALS